MIPLFFQFEQFRRCDCFHFRNDIVRFFKFDHPAEFLRVQHIDDMAAVRNLHSGRVCIPVYGDHLHAETLHLDHDFLAELACAEK